MVLISSWRISFCRICGITRIAHRLPNVRRKSWAVAVFGFFPDCVLTFAVFPSPEITFFVWVNDKSAQICQGNRKTYALGGDSWALSAGGPQSRGRSGASGAGRSFARQQYRRRDWIRSCRSRIPILTRSPGRPQRFAGPTRTRASIGPLPVIPLALSTGWFRQLP